MYIVFEGIDGSGKTTLSTKLAELLRASGIEVVHTREMGRYASDVAEKIRDVGRDPRMLRLVPEAELMLGMAREAQVMRESVLPAVARGAHVITDRSVYSWMALAVDGRKLDPKAVRDCAELATGGVWPDLVVVCDVDLRTSRRRKRLQKVTDHRVGQVSRKGLGGLVLRAAQRDGLLRMAAADPEHWVVVDNAGGTIEQSLAAIAEAVGRRFGRSLAAPAPAPAPAPRPRSGTRELPALSCARRDVAGLEATLFAMLDQAAAGDPAFVAFLLAGLDHPRLFGLRDRLAETHPALCAWGLRGARSPEAHALRERLLGAEPAYVALSVAERDDDEAWSIRDRAVDKAPGAVAASLKGLATARAFALRKSLGKKARREVLGSLAWLDVPEAWELRRSQGPKDPLGLGKSLTGLDGDAAWSLREQLADQPLALLASVAAVASERAMAVREPLLDAAPRLVLDTLRGVSTPRSFALRAKLSHMGKELCDSVHALDADEAWSIRAAHAAAWPQTAVRSLGAALAQTDAGGDFVWPIVEACRADLHVLKVAYLVLTRPPTEEEEGAVEVDLPT